MANPRDKKPVFHTKKHIARLERERQQTRLILAAFIAILVVVVGLVVYGYLDINYLQARRPIAKVADVGISIGDWQTRVRLERRRLINQLQLYQKYSQDYGMDLSSQEQQITAQLDSPTVLGQSILDEMINEELIRQEAAKRGLTASDTEVQQAIEASYMYYPSGTPTPTITPTSVTFPTLSPETLALVTITPTPTEFMTPTASPTATPDPLLSPTPTSSLIPSPTSGASPTPEPTSTPFPTATAYTEQGFKQAYQSSIDQLKTQGVSEDMVRKLYENSILREKLFNEVTADVPHTKEQVWARHILVADEATAIAIRKRLVNGEDFSKIAAEFSTDTSNKDQGGDLGWFGKDVMAPEFETAAFSLKIAELSQPVKTQYGYHIIQVLAHTNVPLDANQYEQARQSAFTTWLEEARKTYKVVSYDNWQDIVPTDPVTTALAQ